MLEVRGGFEQANKSMSGNVGQAKVVRRVRSTQWRDLHLDPRRSCEVSRNWAPHSWCCSCASCACSFEIRRERSRVSLDDEPNVWPPQMTSSPLKRPVITSSGGSRNREYTREAYRMSSDREAITEADTAAETSPAQRGRAGGGRRVRLRRGGRGSARAAVTVRACMKT